MGQRLAAAVAAAPAGDLLLALAGNVHTRTAPGVPWDATYRPAGIALESRWPQRTIALLLGGPPGQTWMCSTADAASCGIARLAGVPTGDADAVELYAEPRDGYEGAVRLPASTPSPPAMPPASTDAPAS